MAYRISTRIGSIGRETPLADTRVLASSVFTSDKGSAYPRRFSRGDFNRFRSIYGDPSGGHECLSEILTVMGGYSFVGCRAVPEQHSYGATLLYQNTVNQQLVQENRTLYPHCGIKIEDFDALPEGEGASGSVRMLIEVGDQGLGAVQGVVVDGYARDGGTGVLTISVSQDGLDGSNVAGSNSLGQFLPQRMIAVRKTAPAGENYEFTKVDGADEFTIASTLFPEGTGGYDSVTDFQAQFDLYTEGNLQFTLGGALVISKLLDEDLTFSFVKDDITDYFTLTIQNSLSETLGSYVVSFTRGDTNNQGVSVFIEDVLLDNPYIKYLRLQANPIALSTGEGLQISEDAFTLSSGISFGSVGSEEVGVAMEKIGDFGSQNINVYFDSIGAETVADSNAIHSAIANVVNSRTKFRYSDIILTTAGALTPEDVESPAGETSITKRGSNYSIYFSWANIIDPFTGDRLMSNLSGDIALGRCHIHFSRNGSYAQSYANEGQIGGQILSGRALSLRYPRVSNETRFEEVFDRANVNPVMFRPKYGFMITSHRAMINITNIFTYSERRSWVNQYQEYVEENVLPDYIDKPVKGNRQRLYQTISLYLQEQKDRENIFDFRLNTSDELNTPEVLSQGRYIVRTGIQFQPQMGFFEFNIDGVSRIDNLEDVIGSGSGA